MKRLQPSCIVFGWKLYHSDKMFLHPSFIPFIDPNQLELRVVLLHTWFSSYIWFSFTSFFLRRFDQITAFPEWAWGCKVWDSELAFFNSKWACCVCWGYSRFVCTECFARSIYFI